MILCPAIVARLARAQHAFDRIDSGRPTEVDWLQVSVLMHYLPGPPQPPQPDPCPVELAIEAVQRATEGLVGQDLHEALARIVLAVLAEARVPV